MSTCAITQKLCSIPARVNTGMNSIHKNIAKVNISDITNATSRIALKCISYLVQASLFHNFQNLAAFGFFFGFVFDEKVKEVVNKVNDGFDSCKSLFEKTVLVVAGGAIALYFLPPSTIAVTLYFSADWGARVYQSSSERLKKYNERNNPI
jgi:hypothetical protein